MSSQLNAIVHFTIYSFIAALHYHDVNVYTLLMLHIVAPSRLELDDNIVTFCSNINNEPVVICYRVYIYITLYESIVYMWIHLDF